MITFLRSLFLGLSLSLLSGCTFLVDLTPEELKSPKFFRETVHLKTTIKNIQKIYPLYGHNYCPWTTTIILTEKSAIVWWETGGNFGSDAMALIDFKQEDLTVPYVTAKIYLKNTFWRKKPQDFIRILQYKLPN